MASSEEDGDISFKGEQYVYHYRTGHATKYEVTEHDNRMHVEDASETE